MATVLYFDPEGVAFGERLLNQIDSRSFLYHVQVPTSSSYVTIVQSFPTLIVIGIYERFLAQGQRFRESSSGAAHDIYSSFSRSVKNVPFLESLVGSSTTDLYDAIFDVDASQTYELFDSDDEHDHPALHSAVSRDSLRVPSPPPQHQPPPRSPLGPRRAASPRAPRSPTHRQRYGSPGASPVLRSTALPDLVEPYNSAEIQTVGPRSPLSQLFTGRRGAGRRTVSASHERLAPPPPGSAGSDAGVRRLEGLVEEIRALPVNKLKEEMKELQVRALWLSVAVRRSVCADGALFPIQDRQARIENLLLMLTRGMRNETGTPSSLRHDSI